MNDRSDDAAQPGPNETPWASQVDTRFMESLLGYNARRASLVIIGEFLKRMAVYELRPVDFSVLCLITHNPGITSRQLCNVLGIHPPNLVGMVNAFDARKLIVRKPHPSDGRATGLYLTTAGKKLMHDAQRTAESLENEKSSGLTAGEKETLIRLLQKIYL